MKVISIILVVVTMVHLAFRLWVRSYLSDENNLQKYLIGQKFHKKQEPWVRAFGLVILLQIVMVVVWVIAFICYIF